MNLYYKVYTISVIKIHIYRYEKKKKQDFYKVAEFLFILLSSISSWDFFTINLFDLNIKRKEKIIII